jgi:hypothetical protein
MGFEVKKYLKAVPSSKLLTYLAANGEFCCFCA